MAAVHLNYETEVAIIFSSLLLHITK